MASLDSPGQMARREQGWATKFIILCPIKVSQCGLSCVADELSVDSVEYWTQDGQCILVAC